MKATQGDPLGKLEAQTWNTPGCATNAAVTGTVSCVLLMKLTVGNVPFTETREFGVKPVPFKVSVKPGLPEKTERWAKAGKIERRRDGVVVSGDENFVGDGEHFWVCRSTEVVSPSGKEPSGIRSFGEGECGAAGIETVKGGRSGTYIDGASTTLVNVVYDVELGREVCGVGGAGGRQNDAMARSNGSVAPVTEGIAGSEAIRIFGIIHAQGVAAAGSPARIVEGGEVLRRIPEAAISDDVNIGTEGIRRDVDGIDWVGREL